MARSTAAAARAQSFADEAAEHFARADATGKPALFIPGATSLPSNNNLGFQYEDEADAFPAVDAGCEPLGNLVLVQIRQPMLRTSGGLVIDSETRKTEFDNTQVAKVIAVGPLAFRSRETGQLWPEGAWCQVGDYVRVPKYQGDRMSVPYTRVDFEIDDYTGKRRQSEVIDHTILVLFKDLALMGKYPTLKAALAARAFI
jgi:co-chaperonin GroES (HSP10)